MSHVSCLRRQRGVTLIVGLIMLVLITLIVTSSFTLSTANLKAVGNMQSRNEVIAAANVAIERIISSDFTLAPIASTHNVDIDNDGANDYVINVAKPVCIKSVGITSLPVSDPDYSTCKVGSGGSPICFSTMWEIVATVNQATGVAAATGAAATVKQGVNKRVSVVAASNCG